MIFKPVFLIKSAITSLFLVFLSLSSLQAGGIPVIDGANLTQNTLTSLESVAQTLKQIQEYEQQVMQYMTQLQQLEDQIKNTAAPAVYLWDKAEQTMQKAQDLQSKIENLYSSVGDLDGYLDKMGTVDYWKGSDYSDMNEQRVLVNEAQRDANADLLKTIQNQKESLTDEASRLTSLQRGAEAAGGRMEAIQSTNQLMSQQNALLLDLKALSLAQSQALSQSLVAQQQDEAMRKAATDQAVPERASILDRKPTVTYDYSSFK